MSLFCFDVKIKQLRPLTKKQLEVIKLISNDIPLKEAAYKLNISPRTIEHHWESIRDKTKVKSLVGITHYALKNNLIKNLYEK